MLKGDVTRGDLQRRFLTQHIIATLFRMVATLFQHCYSVLRKKSSLRIVPCNIASTLTAWISISLFHLASRFAAFFVSSRNASCAEERCVTRDDYYLANLVRKKKAFHLRKWCTQCILGILVRSGSWNIL